MSVQTAELVVVSCGWWLVVEHRTDTLGCLVLPRVQVAVSKCVGEQMGRPTRFVFWFLVLYWSMLMLLQERGISRSTWSIEYNHLLRLRGWQGDGSCGGVGDG